MDRKKLLDEMDYIMSQYCENCFLYKYHRDEKGKRFAHRFCITKCTVGEQLKYFGKELS
ncbi:zinc-finger domain-containing protein [Cytobacillus sp. Hz8]|uniref:zinc-finger domain-containing protein n=1 Tax=Cytobacillus sp. Hz8 TaxID=3347168 RepID=UPI0035DD120E